ncbi:hypothetical protein [Deinococcus sp. 6GRE01]|uniref:hypothetical protein n=1 Tax=Deinococcus sp. 6GRE01 TaxID=2745873 RepID=UPI001E440EE0|nr:hypothetical protein [Deinococcus sp. 6GRE01]MCD0156007.1 hypothetical protein [Deinococcus sp. 6GRE01]
MALIEVSGFPAAAPSTITHPLTGRPWADITLGTPSVPFAAQDGVRLAVQDGQTYTMNVERVGAIGGFSRVRLVGGTGGLSRDIEAKYYRSIPAGTVVREILEECGETAGEIDLPGTLPAWLRPAGPAHEALRAVMMRYPDRVWRMDAAGVITVGVPKWPEYTGALAVESTDAASGTFVVPFNPSLMPGDHATLTRGEETFGKRVTRVSHSLSEVYAYPRNQVQVRTVIGTGNGEDSGVSGLEAVVQRATRWTDYTALYSCEVIRDHGNHELDLRPEHPLMPELTRVRLVQPLPGATVKLKAGSTVLLGFQAGDPARPVVVDYASAILERLEVRTGLGQSVTIDDDRGQVSPDDQLYLKPFIRVTDAAGQSVELWAQEGQERIRATDRAGQTLLLDATKGAERVTLTDKAGQGLTLDPVGLTVTLKSTGTLNINATNTVNVTAPTVRLNGAAAVARVGDSVQVSGVDSRGDTFTANGTITSGSPTVGAG